MVADGVEGLLGCFKINLLLATQFSKLPSDEKCPWKRSYLKSAYGILHVKIRP